MLSYQTAELAMAHVSYLNFGNFLRPPIEHNIAKQNRKHKESLSEDCFEQGYGW